MVTKIKNHVDGFIVYVNWVYLHIFTVKFI